MNRMNLEQICTQVRQIAKESGSFLREENKKFDRSKVEEKSAHNYVSYVDKESERQIVEQLTALLPGSGFIAEEGTGELSSEKYYWVIDPLDGTTNYIHNLAPYCVSIALRTKDEILLGVVYEVCRNECFYAWKGSKAYLDGNEIQVSTVCSLDKALILMGLPYNDNGYKPMALKLVNACYGNVGGTRLMGAAAAELCYIACGRAEVRIEAFLGSWDVAAGGFILQQAGGKLTDFQGDDNWWSGDQLLASNGYMQAAMVAMTKG